MKDLVVQALHGIAGAMLVPDIVLLIGFAAFSLLMLGGLLGEGIARARKAGVWRGLLRELKTDPARTLRPDQLPALNGLRARAFRLAAESPKVHERLLDELQLEVERLLDRLLLGVEHFRSTDESLGGHGTRLGTAYKLANGDVVYVPDDKAGATPPGR